MKSILVLGLLLVLATSQASAASNPGSAENVAATKIDSPGSVPSQGFSPETHLQNLGAMEVGDATESGLSETAASLQGTINGLGFQEDLGYHPASSAASLELRLASWREMRIIDTDREGRVLRNSGWLNFKQTGHYYRNTRDPDVIQFYHQGVSHRLETSLWSWVPAPLAGGVLALVGYIVAANQYGGIDSNGKADYSLDTRAQKQGQDAVIGGIAGLALGAALGIPMAISSGRRTDAYFHEAAERYNLKLLGDLHLKVLPTRGGGKIDINKNF